MLKTVYSSNIRFLESNKEYEPINAKINEVKDNTGRGYRFDLFYSIDSKTLLGQAEGLCYDVAHVRLV